MARKVTSPLEVVRRRRRRRTTRADGPRTLLPIEPEPAPRAERLSAAGLDAARERLRRQIPPQQEG